MGRAATPCLLPEIIIIDTSDSEPDPAQSLYRVAELDLEGRVKPILQSKIRFRKAGRTSRERIERVCPPQQVRKFCAGTQKMTNQASFPLCTKAQGCAGIKRQQFGRRRSRRSEQGGCGGRHALRGGWGERPPVGGDAVSTLQKFLNFSLGLVADWRYSIRAPLRMLPRTECWLCAASWVASDRQRLLDTQTS